MARERRGVEVMELEDLEAEVQVSDDGENAYAAKQNKPISSYDDPLTV